MTAVASVPEIRYGRATSTVTRAPPEIIRDQRSRGSERNRTGRATAAVGLIRQVIANIVPARNAEDGRSNRLASRKGGTKPSKKPSTLDDTQVTGKIQ